MVFAKAIVNIEFISFVQNNRVCTMTQVYGIITGYIHSDGTVVNPIGCSAYFR